MSEWESLTANEKAVAMCYNQDFHFYLAGEDIRCEEGRQIWNDSAAVSAVRKFCGVSNLRDLDDDNDKFIQLLSGYKDYHRKNNTITRSGPSDV